MSARSSRDTATSTTTATSARATLLSRVRARGRERAQSEVLGAILLFAMLIAVIVLLQVTAVPGWNQQVEYEHNQRLQTDLADAADNAYRVAATGRPETASLETGTQYPARPFLLNPPAPAGTVRTEDGGTVSLSNVEAVNDETDDYWQTNPGPYPRQTLVYEPGYNEYADAPTTRFEGAVLYNQQPAGPSTLLEGGNLVDGDRITVVTLVGERSTTTTATTTLSLQPVSAPMETVSVTSRTSDPLVLTFDTQMTQRRWAEALAPETVAAGGHITSWSCSGGGPSQPCGTLTVKLQPGVVYDLQMARIGVGSAGDDTAAAYVTNVGSASRRLSQGNTDTLTVQVRDRFNNPVAGEEVTFTVASGPGSLSTTTATTTTTVTTDENGRATVTYDATGTGDATVRASIDLGAGGTAPEERVEFAIQNLPPSNPTTDVGSDINPGYDGSVILREDVLEGANNCKAGQASVECVAVLTFENTGTETRTIDRLRVNVYVASQPGQASRDRPESVRIIGDTGQTGVIEIRQDFVSVAGDLDPIQPGAANQESLTFRFYEDAGGNVKYGAANGDFFVVSVIFEDGSAAIYFVAPVN